MKARLIWTGLIIAIVAACSEKPSLEELHRFVATETFPDDTFLDSASNKRALVIVAHDDDDCAMSGTIAKLTAQGWIIQQLSFEVHQTADQQHPATIICQGNEKIIEGPYRPGVDTVQVPYKALPYDKIFEQFAVHQIRPALIAKINEFKPSVLFTLDNIKGGYGHPEHIFISQLVMDLFLADSITAERIYQSVFTDHMEEEIVYKWLDQQLKKWGFPNGSIEANELYGITGMPDPDVQITIQDVAAEKMEYLQAYPESVRKNLRKFMPYYEEFDAKTYFGLFDREFFRVIKKEEGAR